MIEEGFLFRSVVGNIAVTSLWVIRVARVIPAYRWTGVDDGAAVALVKSYLWAVVASYPRNEWFALFKQGFLSDISFLAGEPVACYEGCAWLLLPCFDIGTACIDVPSLFIECKLSMPVTRSSFFFFFVEIEYISNK